jgi:hypothetical protein
MAAPESTRSKFRAGFLGEVEMIGCTSARRVGMYGTVFSCRPSCRERPKRVSLLAWRPIGRWRNAWLKLLLLSRRLPLGRPLILALNLDRLFDDLRHLVRCDAIGEGILDGYLGGGRRYARFLWLVLWIDPFPTQAATPGPCRRAVRNGGRAYRDRRRSARVSVARAGD